ncbi:MAG: TetR/AcrR family transcriptional regulator [Actinomycetota bacterium]|nr:TetR/AcrR family transcriptional regulator [Actinomycetota bacterium]
MLEAARSLFADLGWVGTSMRGVAREAGVAMETVYAGFGSKRDLLAAVMDIAVVGDDLPIPLAQRDFALGLGVGTRRERVAKAASMSAAISARTCDLIQALIEGSATDTELAQRLAELDERRRGEITRYFEQVASRPATPEQLDEVWLLTSAEVFHMLVHRSGWTPEQHEQWLAARLMEITSDVPDGASRRRKNAPRKESS